MAHNLGVEGLDDGQSGEDGGGDELPPHPLQSDGEGCIWGALETGLQTQVGPASSVPHSTNSLFSTSKSGHAWEASQLLGIQKRQDPVAGSGSRNVSCKTMSSSGKI